MSGREALGLGLFTLMAAALAAHELPRALEALIAIVKGK
jgi:hypothetical protein